MAGPFAPLVIVQTFVVPVVMISANGLLCLAFFNRLAAVVGRLRAINKERFDLFTRLSAMADDRQSSCEASQLRHRIEMLDELGHQLHYRARLVRDALIFLLISVLCMLGCSLALGLAALWAVLDRLALVLFIAGSATMFYGVVKELRELRISLDPVHFEHDHFERTQQLGG